MSYGKAHRKSLKVSFFPLFALCLFVFLRDSDVFTFLSPFSTNTANSDRWKSISPARCISICLSQSLQAHSTSVLTVSWHVFGVLLFLAELAISLQYSMLNCLSPCEWSVRSFVTAAAPPSETDSYWAGSEDVAAPGQCVRRFDNKLRESAYICE